MVILGPRGGGGGLGISLVVDELSTGENEIILSLTMLDQVWPVGGVGGVGFDLKKSRNPLGSGLVPAQDVHFFYTLFHLSALQNCALFSQPIFSLFLYLSSSIHNLAIELCSALKISRKYHTVL